METLEDRLKDHEGNFDEKLEDEVLLSNDSDLYLLALDRPDCPQTLIIDLAQTSEEKVRLKIAKHPNTPAPTLEKLKGDSSAEVARAASKSLQNGQ